MTRWSRLIDRVRTNGCIALGIGELRKAMGNPRPGMSITQKMQTCMSLEEISIASKYKGGLSWEEYTVGPSLKVLLYDARKDSAMTKLFQALDAVRSGKVPLDMVQDYDTRLRKAAELFNSSRG